MKVIDANTFVNSFKIKPDKSLSFLLGAGASVSSNIPSGGQMVWDFKRTLYCTDNNIRTSLYGDLSKENVQKEIQSYFDGRGGYPELWSPEEYSFYFEKCYPSRSDREYYIRNKVRDIKPSLGYLCMGELIVNGKIDLVSTTNFDDLVQAGVHSINPGFSIKTISSAVSNSVGFALNEGFPNIIKLHGDYLFDKLKNTESELQKLEDKIADIWKTSIKQNGLIVIGYAGNDNSVMSVLEELINEGGIKKGVYWCKPRGSKLSIRACKFMENACNVNEQSAVVEIDGFDDLMYSLYLAMNLENTNIDELWKGHDKKQEILYDAIGRHTASAITNALPAIQFPRKCYVFSSNITTWKELRAITNNSCVAILHKGKVWALGSKNGILEAFADKNISDIEEMDIPIYMMKLEHSDVIGMFYEIIENNLLSKGLSSFGKNKYFDINSRRLRNGYFVYDAIKIALSFVEDNVVMKLLPTVHVLKSDGSQLDRFAYQNIVNNEMSTLYNKQMNEKVEIWVQKLSTNRKLIFELGNAIVEFSTQRIRFAGTGSIDKCYQAKETELAFDYENDSCIAVNQLKGLINYGPLESYANRSVRLAVLSPRECAADIWRHLNELNKHHATTLKQEEDGRPVYPLKGVSAEKLDKYQKEIFAKCKLIRPAYMPIIGVETYQNKNFIVIWCPGGETRPYSSPKTMEKNNKERVHYIRKSSNSVEPTDDEEKDLFNLANRVPFDDRVNHKAEMSDLNITLMSSGRLLRNSTKARNASEDAATLIPSTIFAIPSATLRTTLPIFSNILL